MENFEEEKRREKKKNSKFLIFVCFVAVVGGGNILLAGQVKILPVYALAMVTSILATYFNYTLCKWTLRCRTYWTHRDPVENVEPSEVFLLCEKISAWSLYGLGLFLSLLCIFL